MDETLLASILSEAFERECDGHTSAERHRFSKRHEARMQKLMYPNALSEATEARPSLRRRLLVALIAVLVAVVLGATCIAISTNGLNVTEHDDHVELLASYAEDSIQTIESICSPALVPEGYRMVDSKRGVFSYYEHYRRGEDEYFQVMQYTRGSYRGFADNERFELSDVKINGGSGILWTGDTYNFVIWDNGDYVMEVAGTLPAEMILKIAGSVGAAES